MLECIGSLFDNRGTCFALPDKGYGFNFRVLTKGFSGLLAKAVYGIKVRGGSPASSVISTNRCAVSGDSSACLCKTVHPARAGAIFQVEGIKGVFQGVIMPTGPIGTRVVIFINVGLFRSCPSRA